MQDFVAYGMVAGCVTKGYWACSICGLQTESRRLRCLHKNVFEHQSRQDLGPDHPMHTNSVQFRGEEEQRPPPEPVTTAQRIEWGRLWEEFLKNGGSVFDLANPVR